MFTGGTYTNGIRTYKSNLLILPTFLFEDRLQVDFRLLNFGINLNELQIGI